MVNLKEKPEVLQVSLFEEDYLVRTLGAIAHSPDVALTELVANAWDAGADSVRITIPEKDDDLLIIEDTGEGLTHEQFQNRWMKLGYNRVKHQGTKVTFPPGKSGNRQAYGRNGVGRHGLLCFANEYKVITRNNGEENKYIIRTHTENSPFIIANHEQRLGKFGNGTRLEVHIQRNSPSAERILEILSIRFLHDPQFSVIINGQSLALGDHKGCIDSKEIETTTGIKASFYFFDSSKAARSTLYQGVAFWQSGRLIGEPSWIVGNESILDGRTAFAKRYTMVVSSNDLAEYISEDWTSLIPCPQIAELQKEVRDYAEDVFGRLAKESMGNTKAEVHKQFEDILPSLSPLAKYEVDEVIEAMSLKHPTIRPEMMTVAVEAAIHVAQTRAGTELLQKLSTMSEGDLEGLNTLLSQWTVKDALTVLDEIDRRISTIEAIRKLSSDSSVDELKVLHPLITASRWLFGPEFDSPEYASNRQLETIAKQIFKAKAGEYTFPNAKKRPDLLVLGTSTYSITGIQSTNPNSSLEETTKILIIELKRGGFELTRQERNQLQGYIEDIFGCGVLQNSPYISGYLVGMKFEKTGLSGVTVNHPTNDKVEAGKLTVTTFSQLVDTAEKRMFKLRSTLAERYDDVPGLDLHRRVTQGILKI